MATYHGPHGLTVVRANPAPSDAIAISPTAGDATARAGDAAIERDRCGQRPA